MIAVTHNLESHGDLRHSGLGRAPVAEPLGEQPEGDTLVACAGGPLERHALAIEFLERVAEGRDGFEQMRPRGPVDSRMPPSGAAPIA